MLSVSLNWHWICNCCCFVKSESIGDYLINNMPHVADLKKEVEMLGYFVSFRSNDPHENQHQQMHVFKDSGFRRPIAQVSLTIACRINMMFDDVGKRDAKLSSVLVNYSKNL